MDGDYPRLWTPAAGLFAHCVQRIDDRERNVIADKPTVEAELLGLAYWAKQPKAFTATFDATA